MVKIYGWDSVPLGTVIYEYHVYHVLTSLLHRYVSALLMQTLYNTHMYTPLQHIFNSPSSSLFSPNLERGLGLDGDEER